MWLLKNGTLVGINYAGFNYTGAAAISYYQASRLFTAWGTQTVFGQQLTTSYIYATAYFHSTGTSPVTLGANTFTLTDYAANSLPETLPTCSGAGLTLTAATMAIGTPSGANYPFPFQVNVVGSSTGGTAGNVTFTISSSDNIRHSGLRLGNFESGQSGSFLSFLVPVRSATNRYPGSHLRLLLAGPSVPRWSNRIYRDKNCN